MTLTNSFHARIQCKKNGVLWFIFNPFVPSAPFLYPLKTSENRKVFCFLGAKEGCIGNKWLNKTSQIQFLVTQLTQNIQFSYINTFHISIQRFLGCFWQDFRKQHSEYCTIANSDFTSLAFIKYNQLVNIVALSSASHLV